MTSDPSGARDKRVEEILERLARARAEVADPASAGDEERAVADALRDALRDEPDEGALALLSALRARLLVGAGRAEREGAAESEELEALRARVGELETTNGSLRAELETARRELEAARAAKREEPPLRSVPAAEGAGDLEELRACMRTFLDTGSVDKALADAADDERTLLHFVCLLAHFATTYEQAVMLFLSEVGVGDLEGGDTRIINAGLSQVKDAYYQCLDGREDALADLRAKLDRARGFVVRMDESWRAAIPESVREMLDEIDTDAIVSEHRRMMATNWEGAFRTLESKVQNLAGLPRADLMDAYFSKAFREHLGKKYR